MRFLQRFLCASGHSSRRRSSKLRGKRNTLFDLGFIQFGEKPDPEDDTKVVGDPSFLIDAEVFVPGVSSSTSGDSALGSFNALRLPKLLVNIQGAFTIPILKPAWLRFSSTQKEPTLKRG